MKYSLLIFLLLLTGCCRDGWKHTAIKSGSPDYDISKLTHPASDPTNGIELELTRYGKEVHGYIHVKTFELPSHEDEHATMLTISTPRSNKAFVIPLLQGGQRARLTDMCLSYLVEMLEMNGAVTLTSGHFSETVSGENFHRHHDALMRRPSALRPQNLVTFEIL